MTKMHPDLPNTSRWDVAGAAASVVCIVHCMAMPFVIGYLPVLGLHWLAGPDFHLWFAVGAILLGLISFAPGYLRHRRLAVPLCAIIGMLLLCGAVIGGGDACCAAQTHGREVAAKESQCDDECCETRSLISTAEISALRGRARNWAAWIQIGMTPLGGMLLLLAHGLNCHCCQTRFHCLPLREPEADRDIHDELDGPAA
jgi:hypothetical protein